MDETDEEFLNKVFEDVRQTGNESYKYRQQHAIDHDGGLDYYGPEDHKENKIDLLDVNKFGDEKDVIIKLATAIRKTQLALNAYIEDHEDAHSIN